MKERKKTEPGRRPTIKLNGQIGATDHAQLDLSRAERCGFPEFIYGAGKTADQLCAIIGELRKHAQPILCTRVDAAKAERVLKVHSDLEFCAVSGVLRSTETMPKRDFMVAVLTAGTSDLPVALEARHTAEICGLKAEMFGDVGVAGLHRLTACLGRLAKADVIIVAAGMEGALPSVVGGLVDCPVIAVPTSVGYGVGAGGFAALAGMLSSCAAGVTVVNIDNGFGAACAAVRMSALRLRSGH